MTLLTSLLSAACLGCTDPRPAMPALPAEAGAARLTGEIRCEASPAAGELVCREPAGPAQMRLVFGNVQYDAASGRFGFDVALTNLLAEPAGTRDGTTATGSKVFYEAGPVATAYHAPGDTGMVTVANADGRVSFTGPGQPYHFYPELLASGGTSRGKRWELHVPRTVKTFSFTVRVFTAIPSEPALPNPIPEHWPGPARYLDPSYRVNCAKVGLPLCVYDVVTVRFYEWATVEERQAAIDHLGGELDGGFRSTGTYHVRIPGADTTLAAIQQAVTKLRALAQVRWAYYYDVSPLDLERPPVPATPPDLVPRD